MIADKAIESKHFGENVIKNISELTKNKSKIVGYGSPAKATTALNFFGISNEIEFIIEDNKKSVCTETRKAWNLKKLSYEGVSDKYITYYHYKLKYFGYDFPDRTL